ncbi:DNA helicase MCM9-like [Contarinia nasturtii]|uniref:DNA helicase MCM9-like n=1 Tax=Contarinia nasturtii TaxID=265458 RepID=UPI0012D479CB|nr:DNA helicase MCM9-like [Contarinia nasturtii]
MDKYLKEHYYDQIFSLLNEANDRTHVALNVDLSLLQQHNFAWFHAILMNVYAELIKWDAALLAAQNLIVSEDRIYLEADYQVKGNCHVRFFHLPPSDHNFKVPFPNVDQIGEFRDVRGTITRMTRAKLLEIKRDFVCSKCGLLMLVEADYALMYRFDLPECTKSGCKGTMRQKDTEPNPLYCVNYQEIKIQEALSEKVIPPALIITLESDLVDCCQPGDCVTICGTIERRWFAFSEAKCEAVIVMRAVSLVRERNTLMFDDKAIEMATLKCDWEESLKKYGELGLRDLIIKSVCPDVHGLHAVKLALILAICSASAVNDCKSSDGLHQRGQSHILMIGDPGLAKSKLLLSATSIAPRSVQTTGMGCSSAGLTAAAIKENGEWVLEAGALVVADGGVCCIDEFNLMREADRASIHEAMEQQTISMAKAGIVCKLNTRCSVLAAANPKNLHAMSEPEGMNSINIGIATPLLSRFDLVFVLKDERIPEWDDAIALHLLGQVTTGFQNINIEKDAELWGPKKLQKHIAAVSNVQPKMTPIATATLSAYYRRCRSDPERDNGRTTIRLLDSLNRLAEGHARLLFRDKVTVVDAIVAIRLMESTYGFGRTVKPYDVIKEELPLGPENEEINCILKLLEVDETSLNEHDVQSTTNQGNEKSLHDKQNVLQNGQSFKKPLQVPASQLKINLIKSHALISKSQNVPNKPNTSTIQTATQATTQSQKTPSLTAFQRPNSNSNQVNSNFEAVINMDPDELDEILSFDTDDKPANVDDKHPIKVQSKTSPKIENNSHTMLSDDEDLVLSQALDDIERSQIGEPMPKMKKFNFKPPNRLSLNLSRCKDSSKENMNHSADASTSTANQSAEPKEVGTVNRPVVKPRILCTPNDDENSQNESQKRKISTQTLNKLHSFKFKEKAVDESIRQQNVDAVAKGDVSQPENDSAYDTMPLTSSTLPSTDPVSCRKTGKTPPLFPSPSGATPNDIDNEDLSFLDNIFF